MTLRSTKHKFKVADEHWEETYKLGKIIGKGGFSVVYQATHRSSGCSAAIKLFRCEDPEEEARTQILNEASILSKCHHPNIIQFLGLIDHGLDYGLVLEIFSTDLFEVKDELSEMDKKRTIKDISSALIYLKEKNIIHRDIKLDNIFVEKDLQGRFLTAKLADFGLAIQTTELQFHLCGTVPYFAPEMFRGDGYGKEVDVWALGIVVFCLLSGTSPFCEHDGLTEDQSITEDPLIFHEPRWSRFSFWARHLVRQMLDKDPASRISPESIMNHPYLKDSE